MGIIANEALIRLIYKAKDKIKERRAAKKNALAGDLSASPKAEYSEKSTFIKYKGKISPGFWVLFLGGAALLLYGCIISDHHDFPIPIRIFATGLYLLIFVPVVLRNYVKIAPAPGVSPQIETPSAPASGISSHATVSSAPASGISSHATVSSAPAPGISSHATVSSAPEDSRITVAFGFRTDSLSVAEIIEIRETHDPIASSAASLDRILIRTRHRSLICSVVEKEALFQELKRRNPSIKFLS